MGAIVTVLSLSITAVFVKPAPEKLGLLPYGEEDEVFKRRMEREEGKRGIEAVPCNESGGSSEPEPVVLLRGVSEKRAVRSWAFALLLVSAGCFVMSATLCQQLASFGAESSYIGASVGAFAVSIVSLVAVFAKLFLGWLSDHFGARVAACAATGCGCLGALTMLLGGSVATFYTGAALFGFGYSALSIVSPLATRDCFGPRDYTRIYSRVTTSVFFFNAIGASAYAFIYDITGTYQGMFVMVAVLYALAFFSVPLAIAIGSRLWR